MLSAKETMMKCGPCHWKHGGFQIAVALILMGFLPACGRSGNEPVLSPSAKAAAGRQIHRKKVDDTFKARHAIFLYRARPDRQHPYDQPVIEKRVVVLT